MQSSKYLIAGGPTNWVEGLAAYYAKDEEKRRRYGEQLRQRDAQALKVMEAQSPIKMLEKLSSFSQTVGKLAQQQKKIAAQNAEAEKLEADVLLTQNIKPEEWEEINRLTRESVNDLKFEGSIFTGKVNASLSLSEAAKKTLTGQHGSSIYRIHEQIGYRSLNDLDAAIEAYGKTDEGKEFQIQLDAIRGRGDHLAEKTLYKQFAFQQFNKLGFNNKFIASNFSKPLEKYITSKGVMAQLYYQKVHHSEQELAWDQRVNVAKELYDNGDSFALTNEFHSQLVEANNDKDRIVTNYYRLAKSGALTLDEFRALREGDLPPELGFKAGSKGKDLLSDKQWSRIEQGISERSDSVNKANQARNLNELVVTQAQLIENPDNLSVKELAERRDKAVLQYKIGGGDVNNEKYKSLSNFDVTIHNPNYVKTQSKVIERMVNTGRLLNLDPASEPNQQLSGVIQKLQDKDNAYYKLVDMPTTYKEHFTKASNILRTSEGQKNKLQPDSRLNEEQEKVVHFIMQNRVMFHNSARQKYGDTHEAAAEAEKNFKNWYTSLGLNEVDDGANPNVGILSPDTNGNYLRFGYERDADRENKAIGTVNNINKWTNKVRSGLETSNGDLEVLLNTPNLAIDKEDIRGMFKVNPPNDQGIIAPFFTPEVFFKARAFKVSPSKLALAQINALENSENKADQAFVKTYKNQIKVWKNSLNASPEMTLEQLTNNISQQYKAGNLPALNTFAINHLTWTAENLEKASPYQISRFVDILIGHTDQADTEQRMRDYRGSKIPFKTKSDGTTVEDTPSDEELDDIRFLSQIDSSTENQEDTQSRMDKISDLPVNYKEQELKAADNVRLHRRIAEMRKAGYSEEDIADWLKSLNTTK